MSTFSILPQATSSRWKLEAARRTSVVIIYLV